jgi:hypothetical protein
VPVAYACNPRNQEDCGLRQPRQIAHETLSQKHSTQKRAGRVAHVVEHLSSRHEAPEFKLQYHWKNLKTLKTGTKPKPYAHLFFLKYKNSNPTLVKGVNKFWGPPLRTHISRIKLWHLFESLKLFLRFWCCNLDRICVSLGSCRGFRGQHVLRNSCFLPSWGLLWVLLLSLCSGISL